MTKLNIMKPTGGVDNLNLLSAFKADSNTYVILDSEKIGSMGLPIIYVSKFNQKLEKINDDNEWQSVKNYLKGIINGTNFQYIRLNEQLNADEVYYTPLTLPQASFDLIKSRYVVPNMESSDVVAKIEPTVSVSDLINEAYLNPASSTVASVSSDVPVSPVIAPASVVEPVAPISVEPVNVVPESPVMPSANALSNVEVNTAPVTNGVESQYNSIIEESKTQVNDIIINEPIFKKDDNNNLFEADKETFLKACENMFDALVSKYQKHLSDLEKKEQILIKKEQEIDDKLKNAKEHLANAEARERVANIAHDNAQRVMDISNFMPNNPNDIQTGVI